jgi:hypothetical protein
MIIERFVNGTFTESELKHFRKTLKDGEANELRRLIEVGLFDVNQKVQFKDDADVYTGTPLTIAIMYYAFMNKNTSMCVKVQFR